MGAIGYVGNCVGSEGQRPDPWQPMATPWTPCAESCFLRKIFPCHDCNQDNHAESAKFRETCPAVWIFSREGMVLFLDRMNSSERSEKPDMDRMEDR